MHGAGAQPTTVVLVAGDGTEVEVGRIAPADADLALVGALARLQLRAARTGGAVLLRGACRELAELLELVGLGGVLRLEPGGQPEGGEVLGADEVVEPGDLTS